MAKCVNRNAKGFTEISKAFNGDIGASIAISKWQTANNTDEIPSVTELKSYTDNRNALFSLRKRGLGETIIKNLFDNEIIKYKTYNKEKELSPGFYINRSNLSEVDNKIQSLNNYLKNVGVPSSFYTIIEYPGKYFRVNFNIKSLDNLNALDKIAPRQELTLEDPFYNSIFNRDDRTNTSLIIGRLSDRFPTLKTEVITEMELKTLYSDVVENSNLPFSNINSFVKGNTVYLVKVKLASLGFKGPVRLKNIYKKIKKKNFYLVPPDVALRTRLEFKEQKNSNWLRFATPMNSLIDSDNTPHLIKLGKALNSYFIETYWSYPDAIFYPHNEFVFVKNDFQKNKNK